MFIEKFWVQLICMLIAFWPIEKWYAYRLLDGGDEPLGLAILLVTCYLFKQNSTKLEFDKRWLFGSCCLLLLYILSYGYLYNLFRAGIALSVFYTCCRSHFSFRMNTFASLGMLYLSLPIISSLQFYCGYIFRLATSLLCEFQFSILGINIVAEGVNLKFQDQIFVVDAPCSGLKGLWFLCILVSLVSCLLKITNKTYLKAILLTLVISIVSNSMRSISLVHLEISSYSNDYLHSAIGMVTFLMASAVMIIFLKFESDKGNA